MKALCKISFTLCISLLIKRPFMEGGLQMRELAAQNLALGSKILWNIVAGKTSWSKKVLWKKYFQGQRLRCLDLPPKTSKGSPISKLCIAALENFSPNLYWIPGNGKKIRIWEDQILGDQRLHHIEGLANIKLWLHSNNKETLWDISTWTEDAGRRWESWNLGEVPHRLQSEASLLLDKLQGKSALSATAKDKRGWGSHTGSFSVAEGYKSLIVILNVPQDPTQCKFIWSFPSLPKIDFFCWTLAHNSILTGDNLRKRGMEGPSRCPLCISEEETAVHLLLLCPFAKAVWKGVLSSRADKIEMPRNVPNLLHEWAKLAPFCFNKKNLLKTAWMWIQKFICWKLWLERNNRIFRGEICTSNNVISKIKAILGETLEAKPALRKEVILDSEEELWLKDIVPNNQTNPISPASCHAMWEIRLEEQEFLKWRSALDDHCLFFEGASKGNPGAAGGGRILLNPDGTTLLRYHWGLGIESNNRAEALALWQGLTLALKRNIQSLTVFGDSRLIIQAMNSLSNTLQIHLVRILKKIRSMLVKFRKISFYHILRQLNYQADLEANLGSASSQRTLSVNFEELKNLTASSLNSLPRNLFFRMHWGTATEPVTLDMHQAIAELVTRSPVSESVTSSSKGGKQENLDALDSLSLAGSISSVLSRSRHQRVNI